MLIRVDDPYIVLPCSHAKACCSSQATAKHLRGRSEALLTFLSGAL